MLTVHVAPRLTNTDGSDTPRTLAAFPSFANWPAIVSDLTFRVDFGGGTQFDAEVTVQPLQHLWAHVFPPTTPVFPFKFDDHAAKDFHTFPVEEIYSWLQKNYGDLAALGPNLPPVDVTGPLAPFAALHGLNAMLADSESFQAEMDPQPPTGADPPKTGEVVIDNVFVTGASPADQPAQSAFFQANRFYYRPGEYRPEYMKGDLNVVTPILDFHRVVSSVAEFPQLMRQLGFAIDLTVTVPSGVDSLPAKGTVRVVPMGNLPENPPICPNTAYLISTETFLSAAFDEASMSKGLLNLGLEYYTLVQVDVDGAALQLTNFGDTLHALDDPSYKTDATPSDTGAPSLRSSGFCLAKRDHAALLLERLVGVRAKNADVEQRNTITLYAEDLVRGVRLDVLDQSAVSESVWRSLHQRVGHHVLVDPTDTADYQPLPFEDEGFSRTASASGERKDHEKASDDLYLHGIQFGWDGWSLSVERPGKRVVEPGEGAGGSSIDEYDPYAGQTGPIVTESHVLKGSLPRLRIGHEYQMRARCVDLAGNSLPYTPAGVDAPDVMLAGPKRYFRFEPVPSPTVLRRHLDTEGESLEHLVIRSNQGISAEDYATSGPVVAALTEMGAPHEYSGISSRHVAPPKGSQQQAEEHGMFDAAFGSTPALMTEQLRVALKEDGTFLDEAIVDTTTGKRTIPQSTISLNPPGASLPMNRGDGIEGPDPSDAKSGHGAYAFYPDTELLLPYLPDPMAAGVSLTGFDLAGKEVFHLVVPFEGSGIAGETPTWPHLKPIRISLAEGPVAAAFASGEVRVSLPRSEVIRAQLSSVFPADRLEDLGIWNWIPPQKRTTSLKNAVHQGRHWMLTPYRELVFTHAVQQPEIAPDTSLVVASRKLGQTHADFSGPIATHARSTGRIDTYAAWTEDMDLLTDDEPRTRDNGLAPEHSAHAFGFDIRPDEDMAQTHIASDRESRHEFGDTKHRTVTYHSVATTRFREFLPPPISSVDANIQRVESVVGDDGEVRPKLVHIIPSSSRPAAPVIDFVIPTFRWERQDSASNRVHTRYGKALRVWLARPWFSSGDGEQIAVILDPHNEPGRLGIPRTPHHDVTKRLSSFVTAWGSDPIWRSAPTNPGPTLAAFGLSTGARYGLSIEELTQKDRVNAAIHDVHFDTARRMWYSDIEVDAGSSYFPFVRLALARYQEHSVENAHLSRIVVSDPVQLLPDRRAAVNVAGQTASISVSGFWGQNVVDLSPIPGVPSDLPINPGPGTEVRAVVERHMGNVDSGLGWEATGPAVHLDVIHRGFQANWKGSVDLPGGPGAHRLLITEVETHLRDAMAADPPYSTSLRDRLRERIVYADTFDL